MTRNLGSKIAAVILTIACLGLLAGCQSTTDVANSGKSVDEQFVADLASGLEARWAITVPAGDDMTEEEFTQAIEEERSMTASYEDAEFEDQELAEYAKKYLEAMSNLDAADYFDLSDRWTTNYNSRVAAIYEINEISPIEVADDYDSKLHSILVDGEAAAAAESLIAKVEFEAQEPEYEDDTWIDYKAVLENDSEIDFTYFVFTISLVDEDGVTVENDYASTDDWTAGSKHAFTFSTDAEFQEMQVTSASWSV